ncbi:DNA polymerase I [Lactococcus lactis]|nr:DNA polymerase I [Lactococcus lactis]KST81372.1 DNA polymerase I [Lactococcus lactis subsp. lactis]MBU3885418.1 DNA polymerase I [Lactococcus lactis]MCT0059995.1 DNA polymerase I [Lactococcus lactis subsp. lactis]MCT0137688.1 DNA polymerase I [Lactococcus lactis subsp. lactis]MCT3119899.1 DNA polymerase I [Lactococcus lactis]
MENKDRLLLIDGSSVAFRAFFALYNQIDRFKAPNGLHTNAIFAFHTMLSSLMERIEPTHVLIAFDAGKTTFRTEMFADYKGGRSKTPDEFREQLPFIKEMIEKLGIRHYELANYEADDIIGTLDKMAEAPNVNFDVTIVTGDKDMIQLVDGNTRVEISKKGVAEFEEFTPDYLLEKMGLTPAQFIDLKALMGDSSDNYPGVTKVGEKTGLKLLQEFGSLENLYENVDSLKASKMKENLIADKEMAFLSQQLATINTKAPIEIGLDDTLLKGKKVDELSQFYDEMGFAQFKSKLLAEAGGEVTDEKVVDEIDFEIVNDGSISEKVNADDFFYLETLGENYHREQIVAFAWGNAEKIYVSKNIDLLTKMKFPKNTYDFKKNRVLLSHLDIELPLVKFDAMLAKYLISTTEDNKISTIARLFNSGHLATDEEIFGKGTKIALPDDAVLFEHLARKIKVLALAKEKMMAELLENEQEHLLSDMELPLAEVLAKMEITGIAVSQNTLEEIGAENEEKLASLTREIYDLAGEEFNINSPKQLGVILFEKLQLPVGKKTKTGYSTAVDVLEDLAALSPVVAKILEYRQINKVQSTYVKGLIPQIADDGKIHTRYVQDLTQTGRLSSVDPNLQNIPVRLEEGRKIRKAFVPSKDSLLLSSDYSQIELRVLAHISGDEHLIDAFKHGADIHTSTAMRVFGIEKAEDVTANDRRNAKAVNFGVVYGISDFGLARNLGITRKDAKNYIETYFERYPGIKTYMENIVREARDKGFVETMSHRRRKIPDINARNFNVRGFAERTAINSPIQGSAADILKIAMINLDKALSARDFKSKLLLQVHDEIILDVPLEELDEIKALVKQTMEEAIELAVPLKVDENTGKTWYEAK